VVVKSVSPLPSSIFAVRLIATGIRFTPAILTEAVTSQHPNRGEKIPAFIIKVTKRTFDE
jgi:hypothetical protein